MFRASARPPSRCNPDCLGPERGEMVVRRRDRAVGPFEQLLREADHLRGFCVPQVPRIEIADPYAIESIGVFQQRCDPPVRMRPLELIVNAVINHRVLIAW